MPMNRRRDITFVGHFNRDLGALIDMQNRTRDRPVVRQHSQVRVIDAFVHRADPELETIPVLQWDKLSTHNLRQSGCVSGEGTARVTTAIHRARPASSIPHLGPLSTVLTLGHVSGTGNTLQRPPRLVI